MDGGSQGAASAFWATASQGEVVTFFRHLGEDVSMLGNADLGKPGKPGKRKTGKPGKGADVKPPGEGLGSGRRCFNCGKEGHKSEDCKEPKSVTL